MRFWNTGSTSQRSKGGENHDPANKGRSSIFQDETVRPYNFSSSIYYGGQDNYSSLSKQSGSPHILQDQLLPFDLFILGDGDFAERVFWHRNWVCGISVMNLKLFNKVIDHITCYWARGKFGALFASISIPIVAALYCILFAYVGSGKFFSRKGVLLFKELRNFSYLTTGDSIMVAYNNEKYYIDLVKSKPAHTISIIETDCEVDFAPPFDYREPERPAASVVSRKEPAQDDWMENLCVNLHLELLLLIDSKTNNQRQPIAISSNPQRDIIHRAILDSLKANSSLVQMLKQTPKETQKIPGKETKQEQLEKKESKFQAFSWKKIMTGKNDKGHIRLIRGILILLHCDRQFAILMGMKEFSDTEAVKLRSWQKVVHLEVAYLLSVKVKVDRDESSPYAAMLAAQDVAIRCKLTKGYVQVQRRAKLKVAAPYINMELRAEKALEAINICCFNKDPIEEDDERVLLVMLCVVFPTVG
ncbi:hypothetical protein GIB67_018258 [Kingdonia uniflora]|uniref:Ubiquitin fusion degradation protein UFD1 N-terminal subdomain 2 domain-containing protein n=1 Tax=Kingdonia uniflora TaxID=39325 RepID=A0A7J7LF27_9MAGN|nr:hypothetical protein GIB67_018258 [Kingdonia uniflora]